MKSFDTFDFAAIPSLNKPLVLELARCEYVVARDSIIALATAARARRMARAIAQRQTTERIAAEFGLSRETIRTPVKSVLAKTGFDRQADLAVALAGTSVRR